MFDALQRWNIWEFNLNKRRYENRNWHKCSTPQFLVWLVLFSDIDIYGHFFFNLDVRIFSHASVEAEWEEFLK